MNGIKPVWNASPPRISLPSARIELISKPIPAFLETYLTTDELAALIESIESPHLITVQEANRRVGVLIPDIIGVGNEISNLLTWS